MPRAPTDSRDAPGGRELKLYFFFFKLKKDQSGTRKFSSSSFTSSVANISCLLSNNDFLPIFRRRLFAGR